MLQILIRYTLDVKQAEESCLDTARDDVLDKRRITAPLLLEALELLTFYNNID